ncbi:hypothetical protein N665_1597s0010 [Sinapis alba]|nr:hypothetical protein N665_1597s0010 [Sinapis alba]
MLISKILRFLILTCLLIASAVAQSPSPAPFIGGGRRIISPSPTPESSVASPPSLPQADSPSIDSEAVTPSSISDSPSEAPGPSQQSNAVSNQYTVFCGSIAVILCAAVLAL